MTLGPHSSGEWVGVEGSEMTLGREQTLMQCLGER